MVWTWHLYSRTRSQDGSTVRIEYLGTVTDSHAFRADERAVRRFRGVRDLLMWSKDCDPYRKNDSLSRRDASGEMRLVWSHPGARAGDVLESQEAWEQHMSALSLVNARA